MGAFWWHWHAKRRVVRSRATRELPPPRHKEKKVTEPTQVAKIGKSIKFAEVLPPSIWRYQLRRLAYWMLMGFLGLLWLAFLAACVAYTN